MNVNQKKIHSETKKYKKQRVLPQALNSEIQEGKAFTEKTQASHILTEKLMTCLGNLVTVSFSRYFLEETLSYVSSLIFSSLVTDCCWSSKLIFIIVFCYLKPKALDGAQ